MLNPGTTPAARHPVRSSFIIIPSALGGICIGFDSLLSRAGLGHVGIVMGGLFITTTRRLTYWANWLFYPILGIGM